MMACKRLFCIILMSIVCVICGHCEETNDDSIMNKHHLTTGYPININPNICTVGSEILILSDGFLDPIVKTHIDVFDGESNSFYIRLGGMNRIYNLDGELFIIGYKKDVGDIFYENYHRGVWGISYDTLGKQRTQWFSVEGTEIDASQFWVVQGRIMCHDENGIYEVLPDNRKKLIINIEGKGEPYADFYLINTSKRDITGRRTLTLYEYESRNLVTIKGIHCKDNSQLILHDHILFYNIDNILYRYDIETGTEAKHHLNKKTDVILRLWESEDTLYVLSYNKKTKTNILQEILMSDGNVLYSYSVEFQPTDIIVDNEKLTLIDGYSRRIQVVDITDLNY